VAHAAGGLVSVPLSPKLGATELAHLLGDARPVAVVGEDARTPDAIDARVETDGRGALPALAADHSPVLVLYTSGTSGPAKGTELPRRNIAFDLDGLRSAWLLTPDDTIVHALPLFHVHGLVLGLFGALRAGGALHLHARFEPEAIARALAPGGALL